jgi:hypothetical protein
MPNTAGDSTTESGVSDSDLVRQFCRFVFEKTGSYISKEDLEKHYFRAVYAETGTYQAAAKYLGVDPRTVKGHISASEYRNSRPSVRRMQPKPR